MTVKEIGKIVKKSYKVCAIDFLFTPIGVPLTFKLADRKLNIGEMFTYTRNGYKVDILHAAGLISWQELKIYTIKCVSDLADGEEIVYKNWEEIYKFILKERRKNESYI
jgi:hypothetical protein